MLDELRIARFTGLGGDSTSGWPVSLVSDRRDLNHRYPSPITGLAFTETGQGKLHHGDGRFLKSPQIN